MYNKTIMVSLLQYIFKFLDAKSRHVTDLKARLIRLTVPFNGLLESYHCLFVLFHVVAVLTPDKQCTTKYFEIIEQVLKKLTSHFFFRELR